MLSFDKHDIYRPNWHKWCKQRVKLLNQLDTLFRELACVHAGKKKEELEPEQN